MITRCALCPGVNTCVPPDIPDAADLLFIGEAPGRDENKKGRVFIGKTGDEVNRHYLPLAGLRRDTTGFANAISCLPVSAGGKLDPSRERDVALLTACAEHRLYPLIESGRFKALVPLGAFACKALGLAVELDTGHGFPVESPWGIPTFPMYHPALGIHEPKKMLYIRTDWMRLKQWLAGTLVLPRDDYAGREDYREVEDAREILDINPHLPIGCDTETKRGGEPFCLTYSTAHGTGRLIRASRVDLLGVFRNRLREGRGPILFHNWLFDKKVTESMGVDLPSQRIVDTMLKVFHLGNLPQGLKALALRELGMQMQDFDDVVTPHSRDNVLHYYGMARTYDWPKPEERLEIDDKTGLWTTYKPQGMNTKLKRFFTDIGKNPDKDVFGMWTENWVEEQAMMEAQLGPWPGKCISHAPFADVLFYACRDSDALIRLWPVLQHMERRVRSYSQEYWRAA